MGGWVGGWVGGLGYLGLHDAFHVGGPAVLARDQHTRGVREAGGDNHLVDLEEGVGGWVGG